VLIKRVHPHLVLHWIDLRSATKRGTRPLTGHDGVTATKNAPATAITSDNASKITELGLSGMGPEPGRLGVGEFAFPGPLRDQLVAAIIAGTKTTTTGLLTDYELDTEPLPRPGDRQVVIDSLGIPVTLIEIVDVRVVRVGDVDLAHAVGEGEGYASVTEWRTGHERFWHSCEYREYRGDPAFTVNDDTLAVAQQFRVVADDYQDLRSLFQRAREADGDRAQLPLFPANRPATSSTRH
jgi:uncharacterized protein YhfF